MGEGVRVCGDGREAGKLWGKGRGEGGMGRGGVEYGHVARRWWHGGVGDGRGGGAGAPAGDSGRGGGRVVRGGSGAAAVGGGEGFN